MAVAGQIALIAAASPRDRRVSVVNVLKPIINSAVGQTVRMRRTEGMMWPIEADVLALDATDPIDQRT